MLFLSRILVHELKRPPFLWTWIWVNLCVLEGGSYEQGEVQGEAGAFGAESALEYAALFNVGKSGTIERFVIKGDLKVNPPKLGEDFRNILLQLRGGLSQAGKVFYCVWKAGTDLESGRKVFHCIVWSFEGMHDSP